MKGQIVKHLQDIGDAKTGFRKIAYQKAAQIVKTMDANQIRTLTLQRLVAMEGIGQSTAKAIMEVVNGKVTVKGAFPDAVLELEKLRGVGPKLAARLYTDYGVSSMAVLRKRLGKIATDNASLAQRLTAAMGFYDDHKGLFPIGTVLPYVQGLIDELTPYVKRVSMAGSARRFKPLIRDIDIVVVPGKVDMSKVLRDMGLKVLSGGQHKIACYAKDIGVHLDVILTNAASFGNAVNYLTGSKDFNIAMRTLALKKGLTVNEHFTVNKKTGKALKSDDEMDLFNHLGIDYVPPECRVDGKEIGIKLDLCTLKDIKGDMHVHTADYSRDATGRIEDLAAMAHTLGYRYLGIADHSKPNPSCLIKDLSSYIRHLKGIRSPVKILAGLELDIDKDGGNLYYNNGEIDKLDFVILSIHNGLDKDVDRRLIKAMRRYKVPKIIGHPTGRLLGQRGEANINWERLGRVAVETGTWLEINAHPSRLDLPCHVLRKLPGGVKVVINSDAHSVEGLQAMGYGVMQARRGMVQKSDGAILKCPFDI